MNILFIIQFHFQTRYGAKCDVNKASILNNQLKMMKENVKTGEISAHLITSSVQIQSAKKKGFSSQILKFCGRNLATIDHIDFLASYHKHDLKHSKIYHNSIRGIIK